MITKNEVILGKDSEVFFIQVKGYSRQSTSVVLMGHGFNT